MNFLNWLVRNKKRVVVNVVNNVSLKGGYCCPVAPGSGIHSVTVFIRLL